MKFWAFVRMLYVFCNQHVTLDFGEGLNQLWRDLGSFLFPQW